MLSAGRVARQGENGRARSVVEVDERPDAAAVADDRKAPPAHELELRVAGRAVEAAVAERDPTGADGGLLELPERGKRLAHRGRRMRVERVLKDASIRVASLLAGADDLWDAPKAAGRPLAGGRVPLGRTGWGASALAFADSGDAPRSAGPSRVSRGVSTSSSCRPSGGGAPFG